MFVNRDDFLRERLDLLVRLYHTKATPIESFDLIDDIRRLAEDYRKETGKHYLYSFARYDGR